MNLLFRVEGVFRLNDRIVLTPGLQAAHTVKPGAPLELRRPDGSVASAIVGGIEFPTPNPATRHPLWVLEVRQEDVPLGTEVWG